MSPIIINNKAMLYFVFYHANPMLTALDQWKRWVDWALIHYKVRIKFCTSQCWGIITQDAPLPPPPPGTGVAATAKPLGHILYLGLLHTQVYPLKDKPISIYTIKKLKHLFLWFKWNKKYISNTVSDTPLTCNSLHYMYMNSNIFKIFIYFHLI